MAKQIKQMGQERRNSEEDIPEWLPDGIYIGVEMAPGSRTIAKIKERNSSQEYYVFIPAYLGRHIVPKTTITITDGEFSMTKKRKMP